MRQLEGTVAIVTGASRGIGAGAAFVLAKAGAAVMLVARDGKRASQLADEIAANGGQAMAMPCDVAEYGSVCRMIDETERRLGSIDILVNNAGIIEPISTLAQSDPAAWRRSIEVNLVGAYHTARATLPRMLEAGKGTVPCSCVGADTSGENDQRRDQPRRGRASARARPSGGAGEVFLRHKADPAGKLAQGFVDRHSDIVIGKVVADNTGVVDVPGRQLQDKGGYHRPRFPTPSWII
jgi:NAD(P)-dependent dehydrogenase (short-subunit alcohol dehydrogenase family)